MVPYPAGSFPRTPGFASASFIYSLHVRRQSAKARRSFSGSRLIFEAANTAETACTEPSEAQNSLSCKSSGKTASILDKASVQQSS